MSDDPDAAAKAVAAADTGWRGEWGLYDNAMQDFYRRLAAAALAVDGIGAVDDPKVPEGAVVNCDIRVTQYITAAGDINHVITHHGEVPLSQTLGLLAMAGIDLTLRCGDREPRDEP